MAVPLCSSFSRGSHCYPCFCWEGEREMWVFRFVIVAPTISISSLLAPCSSTLQLSSPSSSSCSSFPTPLPTAVATEICPYTPVGPPVYFCGACVVPPCRPTVCSSTNATPFLRACSVCLSYLTPIVCAFSSSSASSSCCRCYVHILTNFKAKFLVRSARLIL